MVGSSPSVVLLLGDFHILCLLGRLTIHVAPTASVYAVLLLAKSGSQQETAAQETTSTSVRRQALRHMVNIVALVSCKVI